MSELDDAPQRPPRTLGYLSQAAADAFKLLALTGCRLGEILDLQWRSVDWERHRLVLPDSKTGAKSIYLSDQAFALLADLSERRGDSPVVCASGTGRRLGNMQRRWDGIRRRLGFPDVRIHDLRHSFASDAISAGESLPLVGKLLGHRSPQSTARYAHIGDEAQQVAALRAGNAIASRTEAGKQVTRLRPTGGPRSGSR